MDWIEECLGSLKEKIKNSSLRKSLAVYMVFAVMITVVMVVFTSLVCSSWQNVICQVNGIDEEYEYIGNGDFAINITEGRVYITEIGEVMELSPYDGKLYVVLEIIQILCIPFYSVVAIILVSILYYQNKLREPIFLLKKEMEAIERGDLSFSCHYDSADEMGDICKSMNRMRCAMIENQRKMWELMEEQRTINAAFAHDLRTPLTVINGYVEMLQEYYPKGVVSEEQIFSMLESIKEQTERLKVFSQTMKHVQGFEMLEVRKVKHTNEELRKSICDLANGLQVESGLSISIDIQIEEKWLYYDEQVVMEVLENLLSNALRYGKKTIEILVQQRAEKLLLYVKDDGRGMTKEELYKADSPYYTDKKIIQDNSDNMHFGLGLTICKILCKKHGGGLSFSNSVNGGAIVCAEICVL